MMERFAPRNILLGTAIGLLVACLAAPTHAQEPAQQQLTGQQVNVSDDELRAFVKAYVEIEKIRSAYDSSLRNLQDPQEANSEMEKAVQQQGLNPETFTRILTVVNTDNELRKKAIELINEERNRS